MYGYLKSLAAKLVICWADPKHHREPQGFLPQENVNPIEQLERSSLLMASTIHQAPLQTLLQPPAAQRLGLAGLASSEALEGGDPAAAAP